MFCRKSETKKNVPNIPSPTRSITVFAPANMGFLNSVRSSIGIRWRSSSSTNTTRNTAATANNARISAELHPFLFASVGAVREPARKRGRGEDDEAGDEDEAPPEQVCELAAREQQHAERQRVGVEDPLELGDRDPQVVLDRRQRDDHHRVVEHDHEEAD